MRKVVAVLLGLFILTSGVAHADYLSENKVNVVLNGEALEFEPNAVAWNNNTMVPFRQLFEAYGAEVAWDQKTKKITAVKGDTTIELTIGSLEASVNGTAYKLTTGPIILKESAYVNLRFISEALGAVVNFSKKDRTVYIEYKE